MTSARPRREAAPGAGEGRRTIIDLLNTPSQADAPARSPRRRATADDAADLPRIQVGGFGATVDAYALDDDPGVRGQARLWLVFVP